MTALQHDVLCIGNAIVDVLCRVDEDFLTAQTITKGSMTLIDEDRALLLQGLMRDVSIVSGGSAANTAVGVASFGSRAAFIGKVRRDAIGADFSRDLQTASVTFRTPPVDAGPATARSFIMVTPDGQRSMNTYLGACQNLTEHDVDRDLVEGAGVTYLEGYLWDPPAAKEAFRKAATISHAAGRKVALSLSDSFCVDRYRSEFLELIRSRTVDIVFANGDELRALYQTNDLESAIAAGRQDHALLLVTLGSEGALIVTSGGTSAVPAFPVAELVDTTGAGDLFAAGFLAAYSRELPLPECAQLGTLAAAEVIQHLGAHPQERLDRLAVREGLALS